MFEYATVAHLYKGLPNVQLSATIDADITINENMLWVLLNLVSRYLYQNCKNKSSIFHTITIFIYFYYSLFIFIRKENVSPSYAPGSSLFPIPAC